MALQSSQRLPELLFYTKKSYRILQLQSQLQFQLQFYMCTLHYTTLSIQRILHPEIQFYMQKTESSSSTTTYRGQRDLHFRFQKRNSTHRRQGDLLEMHPCILQDIPDIPVIHDLPAFPGNSTMFQYFQGISPHSSILRLECIFYIFYNFYSSIGFHRKLHRVPVEQYKLQTFYKHYILQRKGDVVISVKRASVKMSR